MITLALDTSFHYLTLVLYRDDVKIASIQKEAFKQQSEIILDELDRLFKICELRPSDLDAIVLTDGPGSYTGLRIGMTVAKVIGSMAKIQVYTLSSLHVLAGIQVNTAVVLDARAHRVYFAKYDNSKQVIEDQILTYEKAIEMIGPTDCVIGDGQLVNRIKNIPDYTDHFIQLRDVWEPVETIHTLVPRYLKEKEDYHP